MVQDLLDVVQGEATEDGKTTVEPDVLGPHEGAGSSGRQDHGSETGESNDGNASKERTTEVEVLLLLGSRADESDGAHHTDRVETSASEQGGVHEHERREKSGLGQVEETPQCVLLDVAGMPISKKSLFQRDSILIRASSHAAVHGADRPHEAKAKNKPRVRRHEPVAPSIEVQSASRQSNDTNAEASVQESVVQVAALVGRHTAIFAGLTVEDSEKTVSLDSGHGQRELTG